MEQQHDQACSSCLFLTSVVFKDNLPPGSEGCVTGFIKKMLGPLADRDFSTDPPTQIRAYYQYHEDWFLNVNSKMAGVSDTPGFF